MGYVSDVTIAIETKPKEYFNEIQTRILLEKPIWVEKVRHFIDEETEDVCVWDKNGIHLELVGWKWDTYLDYAKHLTEMFDWFDDLKDEKITGALVRVGEETTDVEENYINDGWELVEVEVKVTTNFNTDI